MTYNVFSGTLNPTHFTSLHYLPPVGVQSIVMGVSVCLSVSLLACLKNHPSKLHEIFCMYYLSPCLGLFLMTVEYVTYLQFCG